eukprot:323079_1
MVVGVRFLLIIGYILHLTSVYSQDTFGLEQCLNQWAKTMSYSTSKHKLDIHPFVYLTQMPFCIKNVRDGSNGAKCKMPAKLSPLLTVYKCLNDHNECSQIQKKGATCILWSGLDGRSEAEKRSREHVKGNWFMFGYDRINGRFADTKLSSMMTLNRRATEWARKGLFTAKERKMMIDLGLIWLLYNSDVTSNGNKIVQYSSIKGYEEFKGNTNRGKSLLIRSNIDRAVVINNYWWRTEIIAAAKLFSYTSYGTRIFQSRWRAKMEVNIRTYDIYQLPQNEAIRSAWVKYNIFGDLNDLKQIPVIYECDNINYPLFCGSILQNGIPKLCSLFDLVEIFNVNKFKPLRIRTRIHMDVEKLARFIMWTGEIPFHTFSNVVKGGWVNAPFVTNEQIPSGTAPLAIVAPYNELNDNKYDDIIYDDDR